MINQRRSTYPDREPVQTTGATSLEAMLTAFGRPKDLERAKSLAAIA
jgi:hypothetical protein